jgi:hypothetical protein
MVWVSHNGALGRLIRSASIAACLLLASLAPCCADPAPVIHYAPAENLEHVDVALIDRAEHEIDMAAYGDLIAKIRALVH